MLVKGVTGGFHTVMGSCCQNPNAASFGDVVDGTQGPRWPSAHH